MLVSTADLLPKIKFDFKRIELLRRSTKDKSIKVTPSLLAKLDEVGSVDELLAQLPTSSTPTRATPVAASRRGQKRKLDAEVTQKAAPKEEVEKCAKCGCRMFRSVDPKRPDKQRVLECMRASCLASLKFTDLPAGTVVGKESNNKSVYDSLARYYPKSRYTPTPEGKDNPLERLGILKDTSDTRKIFESTPRGILLHVPGQDGLAKLT